jgi:GAF domain-containing protein
MEPSDGILAALAAAAADLGPALEPPGHRELLDWIVQTVKEVTHAGAASIAVLHEQTERLEFVAASGSAAQQVVGLQMDAGAGIAGWSIASGQSITVSDAPSDPRFAADVAASTGYTPQRVFAIPLEGATATVGVMEILDADDVDGDGRDGSSLVASLAHQAAVAIDTANLFQDLGRVLFRAAAVAAETGDVQEALEDIAERARGPARDLADLLDLFHEIGRLGPEERKAATDLLFTFLGYAQGSRG